MRGYTDSRRGEDGGKYRESQYRHGPPFPQRESGGDPPRTYTEFKQMKGKVNAAAARR